jgi:arylsulfatase A-like enzyme
MCLEYLDGVIGGVIDWLLTRRLPTIVCFCADHGDCFGEDGCYGHAFYHPKVMEIPLAWSIAMPGGDMRVVDNNSLESCGLK